MQLCGTTRETLYHYEKLGILQPRIDESNGYRYYISSDYYTFMYISHLARIGFSLNEVHEFLTDQNLASYYRAVETSQQRSRELQEAIKLRDERTIRGYTNLKKILERPLDKPQIRYFEEEYFTRVPFDNSDPITSDVRCSAEQDRYAREHDIDIIRHYHGFYSENPFQSSPLTFDHSLAKMLGNTPNERFFTRPEGMYITMCYKGPFYGDCSHSYEIVQNYLKEHRYKPLTGMFVEVVVGPFYSRNTEEYVAELSLRIE